MSKYQNGKIYKLTSPNTDRIYIGSTICKLNNRFSLHKYETKHNKVNNSSAIIFRYGETKIELIENFPCNSKRELETREQYYMDLHSDCCINTLRAICDRKAINEKYNKSSKRKIWRDKYKEKLNTNRRNNYGELEKKKKKDDYEKNKEHILNYKKQFSLYVNSMGGDPRRNNNLTKIDPNIFS